MKEAIANAGVFNLIIIFVFILLAFFIGSLSYSKAFKVKNKIIDEIEKEENYSDDTVTEIDSWLKEIGYRVDPRNGSFTCPAADRDNEELMKDNSSKYQYCVYKIDTCKGHDNKAICGTYYRVIAYMYFDVPIVGDLVKIPVTGETKTFTILKS